MQKIIEFYHGIYKNNSVWIKAAFIWFVLTFALGFLTFIYVPYLLEFIIKMFEERFGSSPALDLNLALQIFTQNVIASSIALFGGIILGLGSLLVLTVNGFLIGYVIASIFYLEISWNQTIVLVLGGLVPHGILEIPAFVIAAALGLRLGLDWISPEAKGKRLHVLKQNLFQGLISMPAIALILFTAALIEVFVSGKIVENF